MNMNDIEYFPYKDKIRILENVLHINSVREWNVLKRFFHECQDIVRNIFRMHNRVFLKRHFVEKK